MNLNVIKEELLKKQLKSASVDILVYPNKDYVIIPRGRSLDKEWVGAKVLNYKEKGNFNEDDIKLFNHKLLECLTISHDYNNKCIKPTNKNLEPNFNAEGSKNNFKDYHYISLIFFSNTDIIRINSLKPIDKKGSEWIGKASSSFELSIDNIDKAYDIIKNIYS